MSVSLLPNPDTRRATGPEPLRRKPVADPARPTIKRKTVHFLLIFATIVLVVDALVGEKGLMETLKARHHYGEAAASLEELRRENGQLRDLMRRLNDDPAAIESVAREELGLIRPGELLFIIRGARPGQ